MRGQPHLIESTEPLKSGRDYTVLCGAEVKDAYFAMEWEQGRMGPIALVVGNTCPKCVKALTFLFENRHPEETRAQNYLYGAISGSEVKRGTEEI